jgi:hypothetical protein
MRFAMEPRSGGEARSVKWSQRTPQTLSAR